MTTELLDRIRQSDLSAVSQLLDLHRPRLKKAIALRIDRRLAGRVDPSDVVQEVLLEASRRLPSYLSTEPLPFYPWLRGLALMRLVDLHRRHSTAQKRSIRREETEVGLLDEGSLASLAERLDGLLSSPSKHLARRELCELVQHALGGLDSALREILVLRYVEEMATTEIAATLQIGERTVRRRHREALEQMGRALNDLSREVQP